MKLQIIKDRDDLRRHMLSLVTLLEEGKQVQVMSSPVQGVLRTPAQNRFYHKCLQLLSIHTGMSSADLNIEVKGDLLSDPDYNIDQMSVEEFSAFLEQVIQYADEHFDCQLY